MKTPKAIITRVNGAVVKVVHAPEIRSQFEALGADPVGSSIEEFTTYVRNESALRQSRQSLRGEAGLKEAEIPPAGVTARRRAGPG